jgi:hypothetical protein
VTVAFEIRTAILRTFNANIASEVCYKMNFASPEIDKLIKLFTDGNSSELYDRHCAAIERLCSSSTEGFAIQDLPRLQQILELTLGLLLKGVDRLNDPTCTLLRYSESCPFQ